MYHGQRRFPRTPSSTGPKGAQVSTPSPAYFYMPPKGALRRFCPDWPKSMLRPVTAAPAARQGHVDARPYSVCSRGKQHSEAMSGAGTRLNDLLFTIQCVQARTAQVKAPASSITTWRSLRSNCRLCSPWCLVLFSKRTSRRTTAHLQHSRRTSCHTQGTQTIQSVRSRDCARPGHAERSGTARLKPCRNLLQPYTQKTQHTAPVSTPTCGTALNTGSAPEDCTRL